MDVDFWASACQHVCGCVHVHSCVCTSLNSSRVSSVTEMLSQTAVLHGGGDPEVHTLNHNHSEKCSTFTKAHSAHSLWPLCVYWPKALLNTLKRPKKYQMINNVFFFLPLIRSFFQISFHLFFILWLLLSFSFLLLFHPQGVTEVTSIGATTCGTSWSYTIYSVLWNLFTWWISTISGSFRDIPAIPVGVSGVDQQLYWMTFSLCSYN